jgi:hypothetical protein
MSLMTKRPLAVRDYGVFADRQNPPGISASHVQWLRERDLNGILRELIVLKSDDASNRSAMLLALANDASPAELPLPATPIGLQALAAELWSLGLAVETVDDDDGAVLRIKPATRQELDARSSGLISRAETIHYRSYKEVDGGLFCPKTFGERDSFRFGLIELASPVVPYLWRIGKPSPLANATGLSAKQIEDLLHCRTFMRQTANGLEWAPEPTAGGAHPNAADGWESGGAAVRTLLSNASAGKLPPGLIGRPDALVVDAVLAPPPLLRPLVLLDSGNFATSDLNDHYRRVINRTNRLSKLLQLNAPEAILWNERRMLQHCVDALFANTRIRRPVRQGKEKRPLRDVLEQVGGRLSDVAPKRVEGGGSAPALRDERTPSTSVGVPERIFSVLHLAESAPVLLTRPDGGRFVPAFPRRVEGYAFRLSPPHFDRLNLGVSAAPRCVLHRPLGASAVEETRRMFDAEPRKVREIAEFQFADEGDAVQAILDSALTGKPLTLNSAAGLLLGGLGR